MILLVLCFFFFKQKTAYEMRISDWSSDVCSSDLPQLLALAIDGATAHICTFAGLFESPPGHLNFLSSQGCIACGLAAIHARAFAIMSSWSAASSWTMPCCLARSEEHTSELQSLMRISSAVFCLKKKITTPP